MRATTPVERREVARYCELGYTPARRDETMKQIRRAWQWVGTAWLPLLFAFAFGVSVSQRWDGGLLAAGALLLICHAADSG